MSPSFTKPIRIGELPNPKIITALLELWKKSQGSGASSHWKRLGPLSEISIENGTIVALRGSGFGACQKHGDTVFRLFHFATILSYLAFLPNRSNILSWMAVARRLIKSLHNLDIFFSYDVFRQCCIASILEPYITKWKNPRVLLIGDGYGILSGILKNRFSESKVFLMDILPALLFQAVVLGRSIPQVRHEFINSSVSENSETLNHNAPAEIIYCHAENMSLLEGNTFNLAVNVASMQEMTPDVVARYFTFIRSHICADGLFYCCNRKEKILPGGEILRFNDYPWDKMDRHLLDEEPPYYRYFFSFRPTSRHLKVASIPVPFGRLFDGSMWHRLTQLSRQSE